MRSWNLKWNLEILDILLCCWSLAKIDSFRCVWYMLCVYLCMTYTLIKANNFSQTVDMWHAISTYYTTYHLNSSLIPTVTQTHHDTLSSHYYHHINYKHITCKVTTFIKHHIQWIIYIYNLLTYTTAVNTQIHPT